MTRVVAPIVVLAGLALAGCGDESESEPESAETGDQQVQISAASGEDQRIADDLSEYIERGCPRDGVEPPPASTLTPALERYFIRRYGGVENAYASFQRACESYDGITVEGRVITVTTSLAAGEQGKLDADYICNAILGSDVADEERHTVLDAEGELLFRCSYPRADRLLWTRSD